MKAYTQGDPVIIPDLAADHRFPLLRAGCVGGRVRCGVHVPAAARRRLHRTLDLYRETLGELDHADLAAAQTLADVTAAYLINAAARDDARAASEQFRLSALHDALTGLPNRELLQYRMEHAAHRAGVSQSHSAVLSLDLDRFKQLNDTHGRGTGDELLVAVARRLSALIRPGDTLARVSGDEFVFLCEDIDSEKDIEGLAARSGRRSTDPSSRRMLRSTSPRASGSRSPGLGMRSRTNSSRTADTAMYEAKRTGGAGTPHCRPHGREPDRRRQSARGGFPSGPRQGRAPTRLPTDRAGERRSDHRRRGVAALDRSPARRSATDVDHRPRRAQRPDQRSRDLGPRARLSRPRRVVASKPGLVVWTSPSISPRSS